MGQYPLGYGNRSKTWDISPTHRCTAGGNRGLLPALMRPSVKPASRPTSTHKRTCACPFWIGNAKSGGIFSFEYGTF